MPEDRPSLQTLKEDLIRELINFWERGRGLAGRVGFPGTHLTPTTSTWLLLAFSSRCLQDCSDAPNLKLRGLRE